MQYGIWGLGHLGGAFLDALMLTGAVEKSQLMICSRTEASVAPARDKYGLDVTTQLSELTQRCDVIFCALPPGAFRALTPDKALFAGKSLVSFMAGVTIAEISDRTGAADVSRGMPTLSMAEGCGVTAYTASRHPEIAEIFARIGLSFAVDESEIEKYMAFASCGLGFAAYLLDAYANAGRELGLDADDCKRITDLIFSRAALLPDYRATVRAVATPGGMTERGVLYYDAQGIPAAVSGGVRAAYNKAIGKSGPEE